MQYILIHGLGQNSSSWDKTISYMPEQDHVVCPELSLFLKAGESTYANLYHAFAEYCDNISGPLNLCGLSLGAVLALNYTLYHPEKVKSLMLIAGQYEMPKTLLKLQSIIFKFMPETSFKNIGFRKKDFIQLTNSMIDLNFSTSLKNITCPVLLVCGEKDRTNIRATKRLANSITKAEIQLIENSGHEVNIDAPKELAEIIIREKKQPKKN